MKEIPVSQIGELDDFSVVKLIDDDTQEFIGYYMHSRYQKEIEALWEMTQDPSSSGNKRDGLDRSDAVKD